MAKYTSPLFGELDFTPWSPLSIDIWQYYDIINRADAVKKNERGQVYGGDVFANVTYHNLASASDYSIIGAFNIISQKTFLSHADQPLAWLAIPITYGNFKDTAQGKRLAANAWAVNKYHSNKSFNYYLFCRSNGASVTNTSNKNMNGRWDSFIQRAISYRGERDTEFLTQPIQQPITGPLPTPFVSTRERETENSAGFYTLDYWLNDFRNRNNVVKNGSYTQDFGVIDDNVLIMLSGYMATWKLREDSVYDNMRVIMSNGMFLNPNNQIGSNIISGIPIFTLDNFSQLVSYFQNGAWVSDNGEPPPADWSTHWDIYVKGAQKPDIYITMKSTNVDKWLNNLDENTSGVSKEDIKVEYRYRKYVDPVLPFQLVSLAKDDYNNTRETDYISNIRLNYLSIESVLDSLNEFAKIDILYRYYAEMEFRLKLGKFSSAWCRYEIGVIGSPSVPDFKFMNNVGELVVDQDVIDGSTVTLHYDEYPPDYDPYPDVPLPDLPPIVGGDTDPTPVPSGLNGLGLLTETYKITQNTARALGRFFWGGDLFQKIKALNTSPIENVVGLNIMPINIDGETATIVIGDVDTNLNGDKISQVPLYNLGEIELKGRYHSFLDYEPYTSAFIYLPFVGFVRINPAYFTNRTLKIVYSYDIICGLCNAMLFADNIFIESHQGHCGINVPLIATNRADLQIGLASSLLQMGAGAASLDKITGKTAIGAAVGVADAAANYATGFHSSRQSGYSPSCIWSETRTCYLVIESVNAAHSSTYNHDRGRPTLASSSVGSLRGYTEIDAGVDLSNISQATDEEKRMIREILSSGFYA